MQTITAKDFIAEVQKQNCKIIDVRNQDEFLINSIPNAQNIPLDKIEKGDCVAISQDEKVFVICQSGHRSSQACQILKTKGYDNVISVTGGMQECAKKSDVVVRHSKNIPIMRQVQIVAGTLVLLGIILASLVHPYFIFLSAFVGAGLTFAGISGFCGMGVLLEKMPWNHKLVPPTLAKD